MKNTTPNKYLALIVTFFCAMAFGYGQTKLAEYTFETPGGYSTSIEEFTDNAEDYFLRTDGSNTTNEVFANKQGAYYFAASDINGEGAILPVTLLLDNVNISGYSNIELRVFLAEDDRGANEDWDATDYVHFNYDVDNTGPFINLLWIENDGSGVNAAPYIDTDFDGTGDGIEITDTFTQFTQPIAGTGNQLDIQIVFNLNNGDEDIAIDNIEIWGTIIPCNAVVTWSGGAWDNGGVGPDIFSAASIEDVYNAGTDGDISACNLIVTNNATLTIPNGSFVEVQNDVTIDTGSTVTIQTQGSFIQNNDSSLFTDNTANGITVTKTKNMQNWYTYTYWSSPVKNETIENTFFATPIERRFEYEAANFVDLLEEVGNTGNFINNPGVDDLDDDGNDWQLFSTGTMSPGVGYATMPSPIVGPGGFPEDRSYIFNGELNNGVITAVIVNNSGDLYNDWNFIGNPYPGAISTDQFFAVNAGLVDVIYLWDQATPPDSNNGGTQNSNFSVDDYAMINGLGGTGARGGAGNIPNKFVPSGQGFFVEALVAGNVTFNNSMRAKGTTDNSQFFRMSNSKKIKTIDNKLWLDLESDNGAFNQILVGYIKDATDANDGSFYDAKRNHSSGNPVTMYSIIANYSGKFAIQGKAENSINEDEVISLGFKTTIEVATIYTLSIAQLEGDFLNNNAIYVKDNFLNTIHDLKTSDYNFTSEVGEFNERFEIVFNSEALSTDEYLIKNKALSIIEQQNGEVQFTLSGNLAMKSIQILDLQGRELYNLNVSGNSKTYSLSNLSQAPYIAKVELTDGYIITKKAIKRH